MNRDDVIGKLSRCIGTILNDIETTSKLQVEFKALDKSYVVAQYNYNPHTSTATILLRSDWEDVDVAHELMHMKLELVEGFAVLAWRKGVSQTNAIESAFGHIRTYVDDEVVHLHLAKQGFVVDGEVLKS